MMRLLTRLLLLLLLAASLSFAPPLGSTSSAETVTCPQGSVGGQTKLCPGNLPQTPANSSKLRDIKNIVFMVIGGLVLLILTISGMRYVTSAGDPQKATAARNGIIFALVG